MAKPTQQTDPPCRCDDRELLRQAWPEPLRIRGMETLGGLLFVGEHVKPDHTYPTEPYYLETDFDTALLELLPEDCLTDAAVLPLVDPIAAPGTWAILVQEAALAAGLKWQPGAAATVVPVPGSVSPKGWRAWWLLVHDPLAAVTTYAAVGARGDTQPPEYYRYRRFDFDRAVWNPAEALVRIRILLRQEAAAEKNPVGLDSAPAAE